MENSSDNRNWEKVARRLRRQLVIERSVIAVILLTAAVIWGRDYLASSSYVILADGKQIVEVGKKVEAEEVLREALKMGASGIVKAPVFAQKIELKRRPTRKPVNRESALAILRSKLTVQADKWTILIDDRPYVALNTEAQAGEVLEMARQRYGQLAAKLVEEPSFKQNVSVQLRKVDLRLWRRASQEAVEDLFKSRGGKPLTHVVKSGDTASKIADTYGISLTDMAKLNPGRSLERLQIGEELRTGSGSTPLTVVVRDQVVRTEVIPFATESISSVQMRAGKTVVLSPGRTGKRVVKLAVTYENGVKASEEIIEETVLRQPVAKRVAIGIRSRR